MRGALLEFGLQAVSIPYLESFNSDTRHKVANLRQQGRRTSASVCLKPFIPRRDWRRIATPARRTSERLGFFNASISLTAHYRSIFAKNAGSLADAEDGVPPRLRMRGALLEFRLQAVIFRIHTAFNHDTGHKVANLRQQGRRTSASVCLKPFIPRRDWRRISTPVRRTAERLGFFKEAFSFCTFPEHSYTTDVLDALVFVSCPKAVVSFRALLFLFFSYVDHGGDAGRVRFDHRSECHERFW